MEYKGKTSWGTEWTYNMSSQSLAIELEGMERRAYLCGINDVFSDCLPLTLEQRREACILLETGRKFSALANEVEDALLQLRSKVEGFVYQQRSLPPQEGDLQERARDLVEKLNGLRDELQRTL